MSLNRVNPIILSCFKRLANPINDDVFDYRVEEFFKQNHLEETTNLAHQDKAVRANYLFNKVNLKI